MMNRKRLLGLTIALLFAGIFWYVWATTPRLAGTYLVNGLGDPNAYFIFEGNTLGPAVVRGPAEPDLIEYRVENQFGEKVHLAWRLTPRGQKEFQGPSGGRPAPIKDWTPLYTLVPSKAIPGDWDLTFHFYTQLGVDFANTHPDGLPAPLPSFLPASR